MDRAASHADRACELPPLTGPCHLQALRQHLAWDQGVPTLDLEGYAAELLSQAEMSPERADELWPAVIAAVARPDLDGYCDDGQWVELHCGARVRMGDCPWSDRVQAARESLDEEGEDARCPVRVAEHVLEQLLELAASPTTLDQLSATSVVQLAAALLDRYDRQAPLPAGDDYDELGEDELSDEEVRMVLALHRAIARTRTPPPHTPPRRDRPKPRWPPQSLPPQTPLLIAPGGSVVEPKGFRLPPSGRCATTSSSDC